MWLSYNMAHHTKKQPIVTPTAHLLVQIIIGRYVVFKKKQTLVVSI